MAFLVVKNKKYTTFDQNKIKLPVNVGSTKTRKPYAYYVLAWCPYFATDANKIRNILTIKITIRSPKIYKKQIFKSGNNMK